MPRSNRTQRPEHVPLRSSVVTRTEHAADGQWLVRSVPGSSSVKDYRCPGCDQRIPPGTGHLVTWPADEYGSVADRRHWHVPCWNARDRRRPGGRRR
ncbi:hypothetical protein ACVGVM_21735 [Pseudonocardia bannensis]|uniref:ATP/GTP-binding protein n=1 Tax=Pseudonocardia bannensis TaxID=630973 RepID=A0A848DHK6_9PSEU|nr:hypothetical protein [Pseudonocardia bannensis]NMH92168.1 hypothetical protein [Pseudonocardia bannensis]